MLDLAARKLAQENYVHDVSMATLLDDLSTLIRTNLGVQSCQKVRLTIQVNKNFECDE